VLYRTGTVKGSELGGLWKSMPWTATFCAVGAAAISAFPLFSGFVSKSMILAAAAEAGHPVVWLILLFASAGVFHHAGIKIPFFAFFAHDSGIRVKEAPWNMLAAMGIAAALCIGIGVWPRPLYEMLPHAVTTFVPYTTTHVVTQLQLLFFSGLAFAILQRTRVYPPELRSVVLDFDWTWRRAIPRMFASIRDFGREVAALAEPRLSLRFRRVAAVLRSRFHDPEGIFGRTWATGVTALWAAILLGLYLMLYYI
jgi:multicomponent Na+:H+ antiporter subunit D